MRAASFGCAIRWIATPHCWCFQSLQINRREPMDSGKQLVSRCSCAMAKGPNIWNSICLLPRNGPPIAFPTTGRTCANCRWSHQQSGWTWARRTLHSKRCCRSPDFYPREARRVFPRCFMKPAIANPIGRSNILSASPIFTIRIALHKNSRHQSIHEIWN